VQHSTEGPNRLDVSMGMRIRDRRKALGVSQTTLADAIGLTFQQIQKYERGTNRVSFSRLVEIAQALDCRITDLIGDLDKEDVTSTLVPASTSPIFKVAQSTDGMRIITAVSRMAPRARRALTIVAEEMAKTSNDNGAEGDEDEEPAPATRYAAE
jgi:transcriptional regulator with XRE-family HTH domain